MSGTKWGRRGGGVRLLEEVAQELLVFLSYSEGHFLICEMEIMIKIPTSDVSMTRDKWGPVVALLLCHSYHLPALGGGAVRMSRDSGMHWLV